MSTKQIERRLSRRAIMTLLIAGLSVAIVFTVTPWNIIPTQVTENVTVLAVTEHGCVGESQYGVSVVVPECSAQVGDIVSATFYVPAMEINGYYDRLNDRVEMVQP
ncbi:MAG: hypothetical protein OEY17_05135 [Nitrosopumilus sp.]|nr:hypothetical protein [Nitrosopumilus sp.]MDH5658704.1 hypothetical protein [Nitrosopumilus sp.]